MKLNLFRNKTSGYFDGLKAEYATISQQIDAARQELAEAETDFQDKHRAYHELDTQSTSTGWTEAEQALHRSRNEAEHRRDQVASRLRELESGYNPLRWKVEAPQALVQARQQLESLLERQSTLTTEQNKTAASIVKLAQRVNDLDERMAVDTQSAAQTLLEANSEFAVPDSLTRLDMELRLAKSSLSALQKKQEDIGAELEGMPNEIKEAKHAFISHRAIVAEIDLHEQLPFFIESIARTALTRHQRARDYDANRYEIEIPGEVMRAMDVALAAELPKG